MTKRPVDNKEGGSGDNGTSTNVFDVGRTAAVATILTKFDGDTADLTYEHKGSVIENCSINSSVGDDVKINFGFKSGNVSVNANAFSDYGPFLNYPDFPFTFRHGKIKIGGTAISEVESFGLDIKTGSGLQFDHGSPNASSAYAGKLELSGTLKYSLKDKSAIERVTTPESNNSSNLELEFTNMPSVKKGYSSIKLLLTNVSYSNIKIDNNGLDRVYNDCTFTAQRIKATVVNQYRNPLSTHTSLAVQNAPTVAAAAHSSENGAVELTISSPPTGATKYRVYADTEKSPRIQRGADVALRSGKIKVSGLQTGATYYFRVVGLKNGVVISLPSAEVNSKPKE